MVHIKLLQENMPKSCLSLYICHELYANSSINMYYTFKQKILRLFKPIIF